MSIRRVMKRSANGRYKTPMDFRMAINSAYRKELKKRATKAEKIVYDYLKTQGIRFIFQKGFLKPFHQIVDFYFSQKRIALQIDGGIHNNLIEKDKSKDNALLKRNISVVRIKNEAVYDGSFIDVINSQNLPLKKRR